MLREAIAVHPIKLTLLSVDFDDFLGGADWYDKPPPSEGPAERRLHVDRNGEPNKGRAWQIWRDRFATTLSIDALTDSLSTMFDQSPTDSTTLTPLGFNPLREYGVLASRVGYHEMFAEKQRAYLTQYTAYAKPNFTDPVANPGLLQLRHILSLAATDGIELVLFIPPYHATYLEMVEQVGLWESFEAWKHLLVRTVAEVSRRSSMPIRLFDFSGFNKFTTERVPPSGDRRTVMRWYWEPGHYKSALGEHVLDRIFTGEDDFGRLLTPKTIEQALKEIRNEEHTYQNSLME